MVLDGNSIEEGWTEGHCFLQSYLKQFKITEKELNMLKMC